MRIRPIVVTLAAFLITAGIAAIASASATRYVERRQTNKRAAGEPRTFYTKERYAAATKGVSGGVTAAARRLISVQPGTSPVVALVVRGSDIDKCEDLGRQLRALRRALAPQQELLVWGDSAHAKVLGDYLRLERVANVRVQLLDAGNVMRDGEPLPTPAVLIVARDGELVAGVAHPVRFANARFNSFAEELSTALQRLEP